MLSRFECFVDRYVAKGPRKAVAGSAVLHSYVESIGLYQPLSDATCDLKRSSLNYSRHSILLPPGTFPIFFLTWKEKKIPEAYPANVSFTVSPEGGLDCLAGVLWGRRPEHS